MGGITFCLCTHYHSLQGRYVTIFSMLEDDGVEHFLYDDGGLGLTDIASSVLIDDSKYYNFDGEEIDVSSFYV